MLKFLTKEPKASETQHRTQFDHVGMVTFGVRGHLEAEQNSKKFAWTRGESLYWTCGGPVTFRFWQRNVQRPEFVLLLVITLVVDFSTIFHETMPLIMHKNAHPSSKCIEDIVLSLYLQNFDLFDFGVILILMMNCTTYWPASSASCAAGKKWNDLWWSK